jgi:hypothetical protein
MRSPIWLENGAKIWQVVIFFLQVLSFVHLVDNQLTILDGTITEDECHTSRYPFEASEVNGYGYSTLLCCGESVPAMAGHFYLGKLHRYSS